VKLTTPPRNKVLLRNLEEMKLDGYFDKDMTGQRKKQENWVVEICLFFLITLVLIIKVSPELAKCIFWMLCSQQKTDA